MSDDDDLWQEVTRNVTPLDNRPKADIPKNTRPKIKSRDDGAPSSVLDQTIIYGGNVGANTSELQKINHREVRRISRGSMTINSTIDLHGANREAAYKMLVDHVVRAYARGEKLILVITGKGGRRFEGDDKPFSQRRFADFERQEGVIKKALPAWLNGPDLNDFVASYKTSAKHHGGHGAVYVRLRNNRKDHQ